MARILYHHRIRADDGQAVHVRELISALRRQGHQVYECALVPKADPEGNQARRCARFWQGLGLPRSAQETLEILYNRGAVRRLCAAAREFRPDFLYERHALHCTAGLQAAKRLDIPLLLEVNAPLCDEAERLGLLRFKQRARRIERRVLGEADRVLAVTAVLGDILVDMGANRERLRINANGAEPGRYGDRERQHARDLRWRLGLGDFVLGFSGYMRPWHRLELVLEAMARPGVTAALPVHLYGHPADLDPILAAADRHGVIVIEDAAQAHLATYKGTPVGGFGVAAGFSFYAGKNLGAPGEGGAVTTSDPALADRLRSLRDHGQTEKYLSDIVGGNARMMELVAAMLDIKMATLAEATEARRRVATRYAEFLGGHPAIGLPQEAPWAKAVYNLYVIEVDERDRIRDLLTTRGVGTGLHYPVPLHLQPAYQDLGYGQGDFPVAERHAERLLSLPMFGEMTDIEIESVAERLVDVIAEVGHG